MGNEESSSTETTTIVDLPESSSTETTTIVDLTEDFFDYIFDNYVPLKDLMVFRQTNKKMQIQVDKYIEKWTSLPIDLNIWHFDFVLWLLERLQSLMTLNVSHLPKIDSAAMREIAGHLNRPDKVTSLNISDCSSIVSLVFLKRFPNLKSLDVSGCANISTFVEITSLSNLEILILSGLELNDSQLTNITENLKILTRLEIANCNNISDSAIISIINNFPSLETINISHCTNVSDISMSAITNLDSLKNLSIAGCSRITAQSLLEVSTRCRQIESLNFADCQGAVTNGLVTSFVSNAENLKILNLYNCVLISDEALATAVSKCWQLKEIVVADCRRVSDESFADVLNLQLLKHLDLSNCTRITDASVCKIAQSCQYLECLSLHNCYTITDVAIKAVARLKFLIELRVTSCLSITDQSMIALAEGCGKLGCLFIYGCSLLTDDTLTALANHSRRLEKLLATKCVLFTDTGVCYFAEHSCAPVTLLSLGGCYKVTDRSRTVISTQLGLVETKYGSNLFMPQRK